jgi:hypothetical protein
MKQFLLIIFAFVFEGLTLWGLGEHTSLREHYDKLMNYPVAEKSAALKTMGKKLANNAGGEFYHVAFHNHGL